MSVTSSRADAGTMIQENVLNRLISHKNDDLTDHQISCMNTFAVKDIYRKHVAERKKALKNVELSSIVEPATDYVDIDSRIANQQVKSQLLEHADELLTSSQVELLQGILTGTDEEYIQAHNMSRKTFTQKVTRLIKRVTLLKYEGKLDFLF